MFYKFKSLCTFTFVFGLSFKSVLAHTYIAKKGDTLSTILYQNKIRPIYGRKGMLEQILKLNPEMKKSKGDRIIPGEKIILVKMPTEQKINMVEGPLVSADPSSPGTELEARYVSNIFEQFFFWQVSPLVSWKELTANDSNESQNSKARVLSDMSYGASVIYGMRFNPELDVYAKVFVEKVNFSSDNSITVLKKNVTTTYLGVGTFLKQKWQMEAGMGDELFLTSPNTVAVEIKKVVLPQVKTIFKNDFYQFQEATLAYAFSGRALLPRKASGINPKFSYGAGVGLEAKLRNQSFYIGYEESFLKADSNSTDSKNILWRYTWATP